MRIILALTLFKLALGSVAYGENSAQAVLSKTLTHYIQPRYTQLEGTATNLTQALESLCESPRSDKLDASRQAFKELVLAWSQIEWFRSGPVILENRIERIFFFPDRKSTGLRQVQAALAQKDEEALDVRLLARRSVALQGLGALDYLLYGTGSHELAQEKNTFRCRYAKSASGNLAQIASQLKEDWHNNAELKKLWTNPNPGNPFFRSDTEAMNLLIGTIIHGLEAVRDVRIGVFLRDGPSRDRPKSAALWRSELTMPSIAANLAGLEQLFTESGLETILPAEANYISEAIRFEITQAIKTARLLEGQPVADLLKDEQARGKLAYLQLAVTYTIKRLNEEFAPAAGLKAGFSFGDGD